MKYKNPFLYLVIIFFSFSQVNTEKFRTSVDSNYFSNNIGVNYNYLSGNTKLSQLGISFRSDFTTKKMRTFLIGSYSRASQDSKLFLSKGFFHLRGIRKLNKRLSGELFFQKEFNTFINIDDRNVYGSGLRIRWTKNDYLRFYTGVGIMNEHEKLNTSSGFDDAYKWRLTTYNSIFINERAWSFELISYYQPNIKEFSDFRVLIDSKLKVKLNRFISYVTEFSMRFDNKPPLEIKSEDIEISNGLEVSF